MEWRRDPANRKAYAVDASIFEIEPEAICIPRSTADIVEAVLYAKEHDLPISARGAATGIAGGCLTDGILIDTSQHLDQILEINPDEKWARVQPGVVQDTLNEAVAPHGLRLGPDTSTGNRATIGGMVANNSSGAHSLRWGTMIDHILDVQLVLASGDVVWMSTLDIDIPKLDGFPEVAKSSMGYLLDRAQGNPARLAAGSEGTLGIISEVKLSLVDLPASTSLVLHTYPSIEAAADDIPRLLETTPMALEMIDRQIIELGRLSPTMRGKLDWLPPDAGALLVAEYEEPVGTPLPSDQTENVWALRKSGVGLLMSRRAYSRAVAFIEDLAVPIASLSPFLSDLRKLLTKYNREAGIYGHAGVGALHVRPFFDLRKSGEQETMQQLLDETAHLIKRYKGTLTAEHGDGLIRSHLNPILFPPPVLEAMQKLKTTLDPDNRMSPGIILGGKLPIDRLRHTPLSLPFKPALNWDKEGGFELAVDMCNGNGRCRQKDGLMCPTFHAHHDEFHTTRARAQALKGLLQGKLDPKHFGDVLDLCISCKGCKTGCPSEVDMAKMKSEYLHQYHRHTLRDRLFANASPLLRLANFYKRPFSKSVHPTPSSKKVVLFSDTFTEFQHHAIGHSAHSLLTRLGYEVIVPPYRCCGRPLISKGFLTKAKKTARRLIDSLAPYAHLPIVSLEPSCLSALNDDIPDLIDAPSLNALTLEEFLLPHAHQLTAPPDVHVHVHCHQKALLGPKPTLDLLSAIPGTTPHLLEASCCGMAGSFGYEHPKFSLAIGERHLFPQIRALPEGAPLLASGTSCRTQITRACSHTSTHLSQLLDIQ